MRVEEKKTKINKKVYMSYGELAKKLGFKNYRILSIERVGINPIFLEVMIEMVEYKNE